MPIATIALAPDGVRPVPRGITSALCQTACEKTERSWRTISITGKEDEHAELVELRGFACGDIRDAFVSVELQASGTKCRAPFFHCYVRLPEGEQLSREAWLQQRRPDRGRAGL